MAIRPAVEGDAPRITALLRQLGYSETVETVADRLAVLSGGGESAVLVAEDDRREVVGCIHVMIDHRLAEGRRGEISSIVVEDGARGRGIGAELVAAGGRWLAARGIGRMRVRCNAVRERAHRFYERLAFGLTKSQKVFDIALDAPAGREPAGPR